ncbi:Leptomycin B resistance protein pmd1, partial [Neolecta irregularis DAH-3]
MQSGPNMPNYSGISLVCRILSFNKPEKLLFGIGFVAAAICGSFIVAQAFLFSNFISALSYGKSEQNRLHDRANFLALIWFMIAITAFFCYLIVGSVFEYCAETLILRVRDQSFRKLIYSDIEFFDRPENASGILTSVLATDAADLKGLSGNVLITLSIQIAAGLTLSVIIAWKLALVVMCTVPVLVSAGYFRFTILRKFQLSIQKVYGDSAQFACEATANIRTVQSLTRETRLLEKYSESLSGPSKAAVASSVQSSMFYACSQSLTFLCNALAFWWGATLIKRGQVGLNDVFLFFISLVAIVFGGQGAGQIFSFSPDITKANTAASNIFRLLDSQSVIGANGGGKRSFMNNGTITFNNVYFRYPTRPHVPVLRGLNLEVKPGQFVALVGQSGCGKST